VGANLAGLPSIAVPSGLTRDRLPCSLQLTGRPLDEATVLRAADAFERVVPPLVWVPRSASAEGTEYKGTVKSATRRHGVHED
jgi:Asp-tRNA(Asn)/Glu-tRNA(Gln) amidotransferase A subunit family amidase